MIVSVEMFNTYSGNFEDSPEAAPLKTAFLSSAQEIVTAYLLFDPTYRAHTDIVVSGTGMRRLYLLSRNIASVEAITMGSSVVDPSLVVACDDHIRFADHTTKFPYGEDNISVSYTAGWEQALMPAVITLSILRIATLMLSETGGNIGLTGKSFSDNTRTFINYSNYRKYLQPLDALRIIRF